MNDIKPSAKAGEPKLRFNWETPIVMSAAEPGTLYFGAQYSSARAIRGLSWDKLSPDLTTNDPAKQKQDESGGLTPDDSTAENHCAIFAIATSAKSRDLIWAGTDDGNLQITRDGGNDLANVAGNVPGLPPPHLVSSIGDVAFRRRRRLRHLRRPHDRDMKTYVYRTNGLRKEPGAASPAPT